MTKTVKNTLQESPEINPRLTDPAILATAGALATAYGGFAAIITSSWDTLKATLQLSLDEYDMAFLTPGDAVLHQKFTGDNSWQEEEYNVSRTTNPSHFELVVAHPEHHTITI